MRHIVHHQYGRTYAQKHPDEDFAETFAVWLDPTSMWASRYAGWPAQRKLEYMDRLMREVAQRRPQVKSTRKVDPVERVRKTLAELSTASPRGSDPRPLQGDVDA